MSRSASARRRFALMLRAPLALALPGVSANLRAPGGAPLCCARRGYDDLPHTDG